MLEELRKRGFNPLILSSREPLKIPEVGLRDSIILIRNISAFNSIYVAALVEASGGAPVNDLRALVLGHDKILTYSMLAKAGVRIPDTIVLLDSIDLDSVIWKLDYPVIDKPPVGSWGRLVSLIRSPEALRHVFAYRSLMGSSQLKTHIIQKPARLGCDIRCFVVGGEVIACMERRSSGDDWRSNAARGGEVRAYKPTSIIVDLSIKASEAIGAQIAGVDIVYDDEGFYVNEVNVVPEFKALMKATGVNVAGAIVDFIVRMLRT